MPRNRSVCCGTKVERGKSEDCDQFENLVHPATHGEGHLVPPELPEDGLVLLPVEDGDGQGSSHQTVDATTAANEGTTAEAEEDQGA